MTEQQWKEMAEKLVERVETLEKLVGVLQSQVSILEIKADNIIF